MSERILRRFGRGAAASLLACRGTFGHLGVEDGTHFILLSPVCIPCPSGTVLELGELAPTPGMPRSVRSIAWRAGRRRREASIAITIAIGMGAVGRMQVRGRGLTTASSVVAISVSISVSISVTIAVAMVAIRGLVALIVVAKGSPARRGAGCILRRGVAAVLGGSLALLGSLTLCMQGGVASIVGVLMMLLARVGVSLAISVPLLTFAFTLALRGGRGTVGGKVWVDVRVALVLVPVILRGRRRIAVVPARVTIPLAITISITITRVASSVGGVVDGLLAARLLHVGVSSIHHAALLDVVGLDSGGREVKLSLLLLLVGMHGHPC